MTGVTMTRNGFDAYAKKMLTRQNEAGAFLNRVIYPFVFIGDASVQAQRWMTQGASETGTWKPLSKPYEAAKRRRFVGFPGGGQRMLVATTRLLGANTGNPETQGDIKKLIDGNTLIVTIGVPYAKFVNKQRDIITIGDATRLAIKDKIRAYWARGAQ